MIELRFLRHATPPRLMSNWRRAEGREDGESSHNFPLSLSILASASQRARDEILYPLRKLNGVREERGRK